MTKKFFGTDGIRGTVGTYPITPDFMLKLGWAVGRVLGAEKGSKILVGKDTRISGYMIESALEAGLSAAGVDEKAGSRLVPLKWLKPISQSPKLCAQRTA